MKNKILDFVIVGAPKCGTTALYKLLDLHPEICFSKQKEPRFFTKIKGEFGFFSRGQGPRLSGNFHKGFSWYRSLFSKFKDGQIKGEASTVYFQNPDTPKLLKKYVPEVKIIIMLRDPVFRIYSHYYQEKKLGFKFSSFKQMYEDNDNRFRYYYKISRYKKHIDRYLLYFDKSQIFILIMEEFEDNNLLSLKRVFNFLNLNSNEYTFVNERFNVQNEIKSRLLQLFISQAQFISNRFVFPKNIRRFLSFVRVWLTKFNSKKIKIKKIDKTLYEKIKNNFLGDKEYVQNYLGRKINWLNYSD